MKVVCISDTHGFHEELVLPSADTIIHSGDFSYSKKSALEFIEWYGSLVYENKILVAGNHDGYIEQLGYSKAYQICAAYGITYLENSFIDIEGVKFYGSPWSVTFFHWHFMKDDYDLIEEWAKIPNDVEVLITHTPEYGILDTVNDFGEYKSAGSSTLRKRTANLKQLKYHVCGHIHEEYGILINERYTSINASSVIFKKTNVNIRKPLVFEVEKGNK